MLAPHSLTAMPAKPRNHWIESRALLDNGRREFLIARRGPVDDSLWDFPGGKLAAGESPEAGLRRVLRDEFGVEVTLNVGQPPFVHNYGDRSITFRYYLCAIASGTLQAAPSTELRWIPQGQLREYMFDPAAQQVVQWLLENRAAQ